MSDLKSPYIYEIIFNFIKDENYKYKLFQYSKKMQKKVSINLIDYQNRYIDRFYFNLNDYFVDNYSINHNCFDKNCLSRKLNEDLSKYNLDINKFQNYLDYYFSKNKNEYTIGIFSPLINYLSHKDYFEKIFTIFVLLNFTKSNDLEKEENKIFFNNMNESKYSSLFLYINKNITEIEQLKEYNIDLNKIKKIKIENINYEKKEEEKSKVKRPEENRKENDEENNEENDEEEGDEENEEENDEENDEENSGESSNEFKEFPFAISLFSNKTLQENLVHLDINTNASYLLNNSENFNKFNNLETLKLCGFIFGNDFIFELNNLKILELTDCENITFSQKCCLNLKKLDLLNVSIHKVKPLICFPELEEYCLESTETRSKDKILGKFMDCKSLKKLKKVTCNEYDFYEIEDKSLEKLKIDEEEPNTKLLTKIISINTLKELDLQFFSLTNKKYKFKNKTDSLMDLRLYILDKDKNNYIYKFIERFPNLKKLNLEVINSIDYIEESNYRIIQSTAVYAKEKDGHYTFEELLDLLIYMTSLERIKKVKILSDYTNELISLMKKIEKEKSTPELEEQIFEKIIDIERLDINNSDKYKISIEEKVNCKIEKIHLFFIGNCISLYCQPFEKMSEINIQIWAPLINIEESFLFLKVII